MIRQKWLPYTRAIFAAQKRCLSSPGARSPKFAQKDESWGTLQEKLNSSLAKRSPSRISKSKPRPRTSLDGSMVEGFGSQHMLIIEGLSTSLVAADFHRLAPGTLAGWENVITHGTSNPPYHHKLLNSQRYKSTKIAIPGRWNRLAHTT
jgi:hypothetical protein